MLHKDEEMFVGSVAPYFVGEPEVIDCGKDVTLTLKVIQYDHDSPQYLVGEVAHSGSYIQPVGQRDSLMLMTMPQKIQWALDAVFEYYAGGHDE